MLESRFTVDDRQLKAVERMLKGIPNGVAVAGRRAMNRAATKGRNEWGKAIGQTYTIKRADAKRNMKIHRANKNQDFAEVAVRDKRFELAAFMHKPKKLISQLKRKPKLGLSVNVKRSTGYLKVPGAFKIWSYTTLKPHIVWRKRSGGKPVGRYPLHILYGPKLSEMAVKGLDLIVGEMQAFFRKRLSHETRNVLRRWQEKGRV